jgi:hypothetical protein
MAPLGALLGGAGQFFGIKALHFFIGHALDDHAEIEDVVPNLQCWHLGVFRHALAVGLCRQPGILRRVSRPGIGSTVMVITSANKIGLMIGARLRMPNRITNKQAAPTR